MAIIPADGRKTRDCVNPAQITEFGGTFGVLLLLICIPLGGIFFFMICDETHCSFTKPPPYKKYLQIDTYVNVAAALSVFAFAFVVATLQALPFGGRKILGLPTRQGKFTYVLNGKFSFIVILIAATLLESKGVPIQHFIITHRFQLFVASYLFALILSIWVYIRSFSQPINTLNVHTIGKSWVYGFFMGRDLNPRIFGLIDLKMYVLRITSIAAVSFVVFFYQVCFLWNF